MVSIISLNLHFFSQWFVPVGVRYYIRTRSFFISLNLRFFSATAQALAVGVRNIVRTSYSILTH